jgi:hypothetical protein
MRGDQQRADRVGQGAHATPDNAAK